MDRCRWSLKKGPVEPEGSQGHCEVLEWFRTEMKNCHARCFPWIISNHFRPKTPPRHWNDGERYENHPVTIQNHFLRGGPGA